MATLPSRPYGGSAGNYRPPPGTPMSSGPAMYGDELASDWWARMTKRGGTQPPPPVDPQQRPYGVTQGRSAGPGTASRQSGGTTGGTAGRGVDAQPVQTEDNPQPYYPPTRSYPNVKEGFYNGDDPYQMSRNDRARSAAEGDMLGQELKDITGDEGFWKNYYRGKGNESYGDIAAGNGGYRPGEATDIIGKEGLDDLQMTPEEREALFLKGSEQEAIQGNTNALRGWFDPATLDTINSEGNKHINESVMGSAGNLRGTFDPEALSVSGGYKDELQGLLKGGGGNVRGTINRDRLTVDPNFNKEYRMTDRDVDDLTQQAELTQGYVTQGRVDAVRRAAEASGGTPALSLASGLSELTTRGDQQANRARLDAKIAARDQQAGRLRDAEGLRLDSERGYAGLASDAEMGLMDRGLGVAQDYEKTRLGTEQDKNNRRYKTESDIANRDYDSKTQQRANNMSTFQYIGEQGGAIEAEIEKRNADRARLIAENRQGTEGSTQSERYKRGMDRNTAVSDRTAKVGDKRLDAEKEHRAFLLAQQTQSNDNVNKSLESRINNYGKAAQLAQGSTSDTMQYDLGRKGQSFGTNFKSSAGKALGTGTGKLVFG